MSTPTLYDRIREGASLAPSTPDTAIAGVIEQPAASAEFDMTFMGFMDAYAAASEVLPRNLDIVDVGSSTAIQSWYFADFDSYTAIDLPRRGDDDLTFTTLPANARAVFCTGQEFIERCLAELTRPDVICSAVPDESLIELVRSTCENCLIWYPGSALYGHGYASGVRDASVLAAFRRRLDDRR